MHLYLRENPRTLILVTSSEEEQKGAPRRALLFRAHSLNAGTQAVVEFLPKTEVDLTQVTRLTSRGIVGCLGLINIANGGHDLPRHEQQLI